MKLAIQKALFWQEVNLIQKRHSPFFPDEQLKFIKLKPTRGDLKLAILQDHELSTQTIMEIEFAFKITQSSVG